jgi:formamidopyrimidine-DNA glycosylase
MPELPEVQTTVDGLQSRIVGLTITDLWTDYNSSFHAGKDSIKDPKFFAAFKKKTIGAKIARVARRAKNILIHLSTGDIILVHMKMTGHILYGRFVFDQKVKKDPWTPAPDERKAFHDTFNRFIHFVIMFSAKGPAGKEPVVALSDMRKFAKVTLIPAKEAEKIGFGNDEQDLSAHLQGIGPDALDPKLSFDLFRERLHRRPTGKIKTVLMDQSVLAGVGNIYSDETLWRAGINPEERVKDIPDPFLKKIFAGMKTVLSKGIDFGGDSMSDYRNINGERGKYQEHHRAYRKTGTHCAKLGCKGIILRKVVNGRSAHFCSVHQRLLKKV